MRELELLKNLLKTAPLIHEVPDVGGVLKRVKYVLRGLALAGETSAWFNFLYDSNMAAITPNCPCLFHKIQRPYLNRGLTARQRLAALKTHYEFVLANFPSPMQHAIYATSGLRLATLVTEELGEFELRLSFSRMEKEGDLTIGLVNLESELQVAGLSFAICPDQDGGKEIFVGGLQGQRQFGKQSVVILTRALHGLRPKALLVFAVQQLASAWNITRLRAVSNGHHIYRHFQKRREVAASYDDFWNDSGGQPGEDGLFDLPAVFVPRPLPEIKANKRQMYKRRYAMLANLGDHIQDNAAICHPASSVIFPTCHKAVPAFADALRPLVPATNDCYPAQTLAAS